MSAEVVADGSLYGTGTDCNDTTLLNNCLASTQ